MEPSNFKLMSLRTSYSGATYYHLTACQMLPQYLQGFLGKPWGLSLFLKTSQLHLALFILLHSSLFLTSYLVDLFAIDFPSNRRHRFILYYGLWLPHSAFRLFLILPVNLSLVTLSISALFASAAWLERECWDMYGIRFLFHRDLRRLLTDYGFQGHPLRKDFPLVGFSEVRYEESSQALLLEPVELSQELRFFSFNNPWREWFLSNNS